MSDKEIVLALLTLATVFGNVTLTWLQRSRVRGIEKQFRRNGGGPPTTVIDYLHALKLELDQVIDESRLHRAISVIVMARTLPSSFVMTDERLVSIGEEAARVLGYANPTLATTARVWRERIKAYSMIEFETKLAEARSSRLPATAHVATIDGRALTFNIVPIADESHAVVGFLVDVRGEGSERFEDALHLAESQ